MQCKSCKPRCDERNAGSVPPKSGPPGHPALSTHLLPQAQGRPQPVQQQAEQQLCTVLVQRATAALLKAQRREAVPRCCLGATRQHRLGCFKLSQVCQGLAALHRSGSQGDYVAC